MEERGSYYYWHYAQATNTSKKSIRSILQLYRLTTNLYLMTSILRKKWSSTCAGNCYCIFPCILWIHSLLKHRKSWKCATCNTLSDTIAIFIIFSVQWIRCLHCRKLKELYVHCRPSLLIVFTAPDLLLSYSVHTWTETVLNPTQSTVMPWSFKGQVAAAKVKKGRENSMHKLLDVKLTSARLHIFLPNSINLSCATSKLSKCEFLSIKLWFEKVLQNIKK